ncbi:MAG: ABC transporter permease [Anaerolineae bacterium]|nr:ABC transporter permease [Thermoflexales bacterium]MDW8396483.1 ABC transporter permease [Anaerolineae bacterium]
MIETLLEVLGRIDYLFLLGASLRAATPIVFAALGGIFSERSGVINIGLEGMMLTSAYVCYKVAVLAASPWVGLLAGVVAAVLIALLHGVISIRYQTNQVVSGTVINIFAAGITGFLFRVLGAQESAPYLPNMNMPGVRDVPLLGNQPMLTWVMVGMVGLATFVLFRTTWGLRTRAVGELPRAADTAGVPVNTIRYANLAIGGAMAGLGGAFFTLHTVSSFTPLMTSGQGFIGLAAMIFGNWTPLPAMLAALLFTVPQALAGQFQMFGVPLPYQIISTLPYVLTIIALAGVVRRSTPPAALGVPYAK